MASGLRRTLMLGVFVSLVALSGGCSGDSECGTCSTDSDCDSGQVCMQTTEGQSRCFKQGEVVCSRMGF